jgi:hypothetical protein
MTETTTRLAYHTYHVDETQYPAAWGARLIHREVKDGGSGIVPDRQDLIGDDASRERLKILLNGNAVEVKVRDPKDRRRKITVTKRDGVLQQALDTIRDAWLRENSDEAFLAYDDGTVRVVASPQASYGYIYITAVLLTPQVAGV